MKRLFYLAIAEVFCINTVYFYMDCGIPTKAKWTYFHLSGVSELFPKVKKVSPLFLFIFVVVNLFTFNLRIIVLQYCVGFCHISA